MCDRIFVSNIIYNFEYNVLFQYLREFPGVSSACRGRVRQRSTYERSNFLPQFGFLVIQQAKEFVALARPHGSSDDRVGVVANWTAARKFELFRGEAQNWPPLEIPKYAARMWVSAMSMCHWRHALCGWLYEILYEDDKIPFMVFIIFISKPDQIIVLRFQMEPIDISWPK